MIENCIKEDTKIFEINSDGLIEFNYEDEKKFNSIAEKISAETGVPKELIYVAPYFFHINHWHKIDGEWYFYKSDGYDFHFINELLGEIISEYFSLDTIHYSVAKLCVTGKKSEFGIVSKNFCEKDKIYKRCWDYELSLQSDLRVLQDIRNICSSEKEHLLLQDDLKKFFIRDFFTCQNDRSGNNFLFKVTDDGIRLGPLYDYENAFEASNQSIYKNQIGTLNINDLDTQQLLRNDHRFQELLHLLMDANILEMLSKVEDKHKIYISSEDKEYYAKMISKTKELVLERKLIK